MNRLICPYRESAMKRPGYLLGLLGLLLLPGMAAAVPLNEIRFEGNLVTREQVMRQELLLREGDEVDIEKVEASRQAIMNLGLFKSVTSRLEGDGNGRNLIFSVEERYYLLPIPRLDGDQEEGNYSYGIELRHDNVMGLNHRLKLVYLNEQSTDGTTPLKREAEFKYNIPHIIHTPFSLALQAKRIEEKIIELDDTLSVTIGSYHQAVNSGGFSVSRRVQPNWINQGWTVGGGLGITEKHYRNQIGSGLLYNDSQAVALNLGLNYNEVSEYPYHRDGTRYGYTLSVAHPELGSDYNYTRHWLHYRRYQPLQRLDANINSLFRLGLANGQAFNGPSYSIGNSSLLRGYENGYAEGDAMMLLNLEYHHHLSGYRQLRGVVFSDIGNAWKDADDIDLGELLGGVGVGLRWRVQSFVDLTLRIDYARALDYDNNTLTLTTNASF